MSRYVIPAALVLAVLGTLAGSGLGGQASVETLAVEVAEDASRFISGKEPVFKNDGLPAYGNPFVTQGYIYPKGTLKSATDGVNADGSPKYPDRVIGEWTCWGYHVGDGAHTKSGPWVVTTQLFSFGRKDGARTLVTTGYELVDQNTPFLRAIVGGTGSYSGARGQMTQTYIGSNPSGGGIGVNLRIEFRIQR